jgi:hypothetical protein
MATVSKRIEGFLFSVDISGTLPVIGSFGS